MITEYIRYELETHSAEQLIAAYEAAGEHLRAAPECLAYELTRCEESENTFLMRILWTSTEAHLDGFRKGANFKPFLALVQPFITEVAEMRHYATTGVDWQRA